MEEFYAAVHGGETTYEKLQEEHGVTRDAIKQRRYNIRKRERKSGNKLTSKRANGHA